MTNPPRADEPGGLSSNSLTTATVEEIRNELSRRFVAVLLVTLRDVGPDVNKDSEVGCTWWSGGWMHAIGLARFAEHDIASGIRNGGGAASKA